MRQGEEDRGSHISSTDRLGRRAHQSHADPQQTGKLLTCAIDTCKPFSSSCSRFSYLFQVAAQRFSRSHWRTASTAVESSDVVIRPADIITIEEVRDTCRKDAIFGD